MKNRNAINKFLLYLVVGLTFSGSQHNLLLWNLEVPTLLLGNSKVVSKMFLTVYFGYSGHGYCGHLDIVATLAGTESFPTIFSLNKSLIVATYFGYSGHLRGNIMLTKCLVPHYFVGTALFPICTIFKPKHL